MDNIILQMKDDGDDEEKQVEAPAAIITNAITGGLFRKLQRNQIKKIIHAPQEGIRGRFQAAALQVIWKLRFQRRIKQVMKSKVEVFKSYFMLNMQKIFLYELQRPRRVKVYEFEWDYVIVFPNPDTKDKTTPMTKQEALDHFDSCIHADNADSQIQQRVMKRSERKAFQKVFKQLPDLVQMQDDDDPNKNNQAIKARYRGGRFYADEDGQWHDRFAQPTDVQTLMMNVIQRKLSVALGLHTEAMISNDGQNIFLLIKADQQDLQIHAEKIQQNVQIELGWCDLWSLQPCDQHFYPYLSIIKPDRQLQDLEDDLKQYFKEVKAEGAEDDDDDEDDDEKISGAHITPFQWSIYKEYLTEIKMRYDILNKAGISQRDHIRGLFLKKLTKSAIENANRWAHDNNPNPRSIKSCGTQAKPPQLLHLWSRLGEIRAIGPYSDYIRVFNDQGVDKYNHLWRRHIIDETGKRSIFKEVDRLKILDAMIQSKLVIRKLKAHGYISGYFPLHNSWFRNGKMRFEPGTQDWPPYNKESEKEAAYDQDDHVSKKKGLQYRWKCRCCDPFHNPASKIRNYFGEKIAFYFTYISLYSKFLFWTGFFGVLVFILQYIGDRQENNDKFRIAVIVFNALYIFVSVLWSTVFFEMWKRRENKLSIQWGQTDFEEDQVIRPTFAGVRRRSPVDDDMNDLWFNPASRRFRQAVGYMISLVILVIVIVIVGLILYLRKYLTDRNAPNPGEKPSMFFKGIPSITATINAIQIVVFNMLYNKVALWLTKWQNHRTQSDFESSLISKTFMFQFVNSFNSLFYMAYLKRWFEGCVEGGQKSHQLYCDGELRNQLTIIFIVAILKNFMEIGIPWIMNWLRERKLNKLKGQVNQMTPEQKLRFNIENEYALSNYQSMEVDGTYSDYIEMIVQYGYVILFSIGFPMAPVLAMLNNIFEVQVDKYKLMKLTKRPIPLSANGIGIWAMIIDIVTTISIFTNMGVFCFTMSTFRDVDDQDVRFYTFIGLILFFMALRYIIAYAIPDISENMSLVIRRHDYLVEKSLKGFIKAKPRSILPEKSNFSVQFTIKDNKGQDELQKVGDILVGKKGQSGGGIFGAALGGGGGVLGGPKNQNQSQTSERSELLGMGATSQASLPPVGDERNTSGSQFPSGFPPPPVRGSVGQGGNYFN